MRYVGIYNADGTILGELRYVVGKLRGTTSCSLCDITHGKVRPRKDFFAACADAAIEIELLHRNEATSEQLAAAGILPALIVEEEGTWRCVLTASDLEECDGSPSELIARLVA
jgi:hypothetical protein